MLFIEQFKRMLYNIKKGAYGVWEIKWVLMIGDRRYEKIIFKRNYFQIEQTPKSRILIEYHNFQRYGLSGISGILMLTLSMIKNVTLEGDFEIYVNYIYIYIYKYTYIKMCTTNFLWVLYFQQIGELPNFYQNSIIDMILSKWLQTSRSQRVFLRPNFRFDFFFGPSNFYRDFFCKIEDNFHFMVNLFFWSDSF